MVGKVQVLYHQVTKITKEHQVKTIFLVKLGVLRVLVVKFLFLLFYMTAC